MLTGADEEAIMGIHLAHRDRMSAGKIADQHLLQRHHLLAVDDRLHTFVQPLLERLTG